MYCYGCGKPLPEGAERCQACQAPVPYPSPAGAGDAVDRFVADVRSGTKELIHESVSLSKQVAAKAGAAARDPKGSAKRATSKVAKGVREIAHDLKDDLKSQ